MNYIQNGPWTYFLPTICFEAVRETTKVLGLVVDRMQVNEAISLSVPLAYHCMNSFLIGVEPKCNINKSLFSVLNACTNNEILKHSHYLTRD